MKSFQEALENRVDKTKKNKIDRHTLEKTGKDTIKFLFGLIGLQNVTVVCPSDELLLLKTPVSTWQCELKLNKGNIEREILKKINRKVVFDIKIVK